MQLSQSGNILDFFPCFVRIPGEFTFIEKERASSGEKQFLKDK
jgi:hypothetical protein